MNDPSGSFVYVDLSAVDQVTKQIIGARHMATKEAPSRARQLVAAGDVLVSTVRPNLNSVARVEPELDGATVSTGFCVLRPRNGSLDGDYLFHWVKTRQFVTSMSERASGASYPAVSDRIVLDSKIPLPPIEKQRKIAKVLESADTLRAKRRVAIAHLDTLTKSIFLDMFGDPIDSSTRWPTIALSQAVMPGTIVTYGIVQAGEEVAKGVPYIRTGDIVDGEILAEHLRHTAPEIAARFSRSRVETGDIVMSIRATVGTTAMVPPILNGANLTQGTARIAPSDAVQGPYLISLLRSSAVQHWIENQVKGATFREITLARLRELPVLVPPISLQHDFALRIRCVDNLKAAQRQSIIQLDALFASLQHRAFRGEL